MSGVAYEIDPELLWPRDLDHRYRIYAVRGPRDEDREVLAATDSPCGIGAALVTLNEDEKEASPRRRLYDLGRIGVLDVMPGGKPSPSGEWLIHPYWRGGRW